MFENIGTTELIIIGVVIFIFFGGNKLKEIARGLGESSVEIKRTKKEFNSAFDEMKNEPSDTQEKKREIVNPKPKRAKGGKNNV